MHFIWSARSLSRLFVCANYFSFASCLRFKLGSATRFSGIITVAIAAAAAAAVFGKSKQARRYKFYVLKQSYIEWVVLLI